MPDVVIVGGGVIGCAAAWYCARVGMRVELFERGPLGGEATSASAGILAPLAESVTPGPFVELALAGLRAFEEDIPALLDESGLDPEYRISGVLRLALTGEDAAALKQAAAWQENARLDLRWLEAGQVAALEPGLGASKGGLLSPREGHVNPPRLVTALAAAAVRCGAAIHEHSSGPLPWMEGARMRGVLVDGQRIEAGRVVLAAGAWSAGWADVIGVRVPVRPVKGQMILLRAIPPPVRHVVFAGHSYFVPRADGTVYVGATQEEAGFDQRVTAGGLQELTEMVAHLLPALRDAELVRAHAGLRPGSADGLPVLGPAPGVEGLILAAGHFRNGILMSLITGRIVRALVAGEPPEVPVDAFLADRFGALTG